jgi:hypothetical protein
MGFVAMSSPFMPGSFGSQCIFLRYADNLNVTTDGQFVYASFWMNQRGTTFLTRRGCKLSMWIQIAPAYWQNEITVTDSARGTVK